jgi:hypothetical protein
MTWHEVTRMNIYAFNHKCKYLVHKRKKEIASKRGR